MKTDPIAWVDVEDAIASWVRGSTRFSTSEVRLVPQRDTGAARGPAPKCQVFLLSMVQQSQVMQRRYRQVQQQRYTVTAVGPGTVGVDFYPGLSLVPQAIAYVAGAGESTVSSAAGLLAEMIANLPAGYTASADPSDTSSVLVDGATATPIFAALPLDPSLLTVADAIPNIADLLMVQFRLVWRLDFRSAATNGATQATNGMMNCITLRQELLDPTMRRLGFNSEGSPFQTMAIAPDRVESLAVYDVAFRGRMTIAVARTAGRAISSDVQPLAA